MRLEVDGAPCIAYPRLTGEVEVGDDVLVNGRRSSSSSAPAASTSSTRTSRAACSSPSSRRPRDDAAVHARTGRDAVRRGGRRRGRTGTARRPARRLLGAPQPARARLRGARGSACRLRAARRRSAARLAVGHGADPQGTPAPRHDDRRLACLDGDVQCVTAAARALEAVGRGAEVVVCGIGPGIVGTASRWGHGGLAVADAANAAAALGALPVVAPRVSFADERPRHRGVSHHTRSALELCLGEGPRRLAVGLEPPEGVETSTSTPPDGRRLRAPAAGPHGARAGRRSLVLRRRLRRRAPRGRLIAPAMVRYRPARHADRRREGDQAAGVPRRADAGRRARARPARPRGRWSRPARATGSALLRRRVRARRARASSRSTRSGRASELLLKVKEPIAPEYARLREGLTLFTYLHIAADEPLTRALARLGHRRRRLRDRRDRRPPRCRCSRR